MLKIGITGGIGTGKTTVCRIFETLGIPVFNADEESKKMLMEDAEVARAVKAVFGASVYHDNVLNKKELAAIVFSDPEKLAKLNAITHPAVFRKFEAWCSLKQQASYVIKEAALIYEAGADAALDAVIVVTAPEALRLKRVARRDRVSDEDIRLRMKHQWPEEEKIKRAKFIIHNDEEHLLIPQVLTIHHTLLHEPD
ncbi:MAG TPA: dephospho-CoA kinase [Chitinophagales bacterium]|nr:dephospho-CoA kinase [Chitinophagales bacterium]